MNSRGWRGFDSM